MVFAQIIGSRNFGAKLEVEARVGERVLNDSRILPNLARSFTDDNHRRPQLLATSSATSTACVNFKMAQVPIQTIHRDPQLLYVTP